MDGHPGLSLDIGAYSSNDWHEFPEDYFETDADAGADVLVNELSDGDTDFSSSLDEEPQRNPAGTFYSLPAPTNARFWKKLHRVDVVTSLVIRRQTQRQLAPENVHRLLRNLARLEHVWYERMRELDGVDEQEADAGVCLP